MFKKKILIKCLNNRIFRSNTTFKKYDFLKDLGLNEKNLGAYYGGKWSGKGKEVVSLNPATNEVIATSTTVFIFHYLGNFRGI
jgi:hypothetical protein